MKYHFKGRYVILLLNFVFIFFVANQLMQVRNMLPMQLLRHKVLW